MDESLPFEALQPELQLRVLSFCTTQELLNSAPVSRAFRDKAYDEHLWREMFEARWPDAGFMPSDGGATTSFWRLLYRGAHRAEREAKVLQAGGRSLALSSLAQSSFDGDQSIEWTLQPAYLWSSVGVTDQDSDEFLAYTLAGPALVTAIELSPMGSQQCYAPQAARLRLGFTREAPVPGRVRTGPCEVDTVAGVLPLPPDSPVRLAEDALAIYPYVAPCVVMRNERVAQIVAAPPSSLPFVTALRLDLLKRYSRHFVAGLEHLYYTCLTRVRAYGCPLALLEDAEPTLAAAVRQRAIRLGAPAVVVAKVPGAAEATAAAAAAPPPGPGADPGGDWEGEDEDGEWAEAGGDDDMTG